MNLHECNINYENFANEFEKQNVHTVYDIISKHFSTTRKIIWPKVEDFIKSFKPGSIIADIGCGNGKNMCSRDDCYYFGIDTCKSLMDQAKINNNCQFIEGNCTDIPLKSCSIDYCMCIAVIHHLSTPERRIKAIHEISRILKKKGKALLYVWAFEQPKFENEESQDVKVKWLLQKKYNIYDEDKQFSRYYHLFKKNELELLINNVNNFNIIESGNQYHNWYCIVEKV